MSPIERSPPVGEPVGVPHGIATKVWTQLIIRCVFAERDLVDICLVKVAEPFKVVRLMNSRNEGVGAREVLIE